MNGGEQKQVYTVADFMATKFGSTKNRGQRARAQMQMPPTPQVQHQPNPAAAQQIYQQRNTRYKFVISSLVTLTIG